MHGRIIAAKRKPGLEDELKDVETMLNSLESTRTNTESAYGSFVHLRQLLSEYDPQIHTAMH